MPPPAMPPSEAGDPEVSSRRVSPNPAGAEGGYAAPRGSPHPAFERGHGMSLAPSGARPEELKISARASFYLRGAPHIDGHGD